MVWRRNDDGAGQGGPGHETNDPDELGGEAAPALRRLDGIRSGAPVDRERDLRAQALDAYGRLDEASERLVAAIVRLVEARCTWNESYQAATSRMSEDVQPLIGGRSAGASRTQAPWPSEAEHPTVWSLLQPDAPKTNPDPAQLKTELRKWVTSWQGAHRYEAVAWPPQAAEREHPFTLEPAPGPETGGQEPEYAPVTGAHEDSASKATDTGNAGDLPRPAATEAVVRWTDAHFEPEPSEESDPTAIPITTMFGSSRTSRRLADQPEDDANDDVGPFQARYDRPSSPTRSRALHISGIGSFSWDLDDQLPEPPRIERAMPDRSIEGERRHVLPFVKERHNILDPGDMQVPENLIEPVFEMDDEAFEAS